MIPPRISIITPSFNQGQFLEECIDSVLSQNYPNLEYIVMDGGSADNSVEIIKKFEKHLTYWQSKPDGGQYAAIDAGFKKTSGEIMAWLNSDDKYHTAAFFKAAYIFYKYKEIEWITGRPTVFDKDGNIILVFDYLPAFSRGNYLYEGYDKPHIQQESTFWRRSIWEKAGGMVRADLNFAGDMELWTRFFRHAQLFTVDTILGGYRYHGNQKAIVHLDKYVKEADTVLDDEIALLRKGEFRELLPVTNPITVSHAEMKSFIDAIYEADQYTASKPSADIDLVIAYFIKKIADMQQDNLGTAQTLGAQLQKTEVDLNQQVSSLNAEVAGLSMQITGLNKQLDAVNAQLDSILTSKSWLLTKPLRFVRRCLSIPKKRYPINNVATDTNIKSHIMPKTAPLFSDARLQELTVRYKDYSIQPVSYATVKDFCDSFDHLRPFAVLSGDLKDVQRTWTIKTLLAILPKSARILEIGAGEPWVCDFIARLGYEVWICDPYDGTGNGPVDYERYRLECPNIRFVRAFFNPVALDVLEQYFDVIFSISVLEHVPIDDLEEVFKGIRKYLKPSGYSIHSVDHVHKGAAAYEHLQVLRRINSMSGNTDEDLDAIIRALSDDIETYYLSAEGHNLWRGGVAYEKFPMRVCVSIHFCSSSGKIRY